MGFSLQCGEVQGEPLIILVIMMECLTWQLATPNQTQYANPPYRDPAQHTVHTSTHRKKKVHEFPVSSRDVPNQTSPGQE
jgi:hypothetical protein